MATEIIFDEVSIRIKDHSIAPIDDGHSGHGVVHRTSPPAIDLELDRLFSVVVNRRAIGRHELNLLLQRHELTRHFLPLRPHVPPCASVKWSHPPLH